jgi:type IV secretory pathway VirB10-like protein
MADTVTTAADANLTDHTTQPKGVLQKNLKMYLYLGAVVLLILATVISSRKKAPTDAEKAKASGPQPYVQDNTANNVDALQRQLGADKLKAQQDAELAASTGNPAAGGTGAQQAAASGFGADGRPLAPSGTYVANGQPNGTQANGQPQLTPSQQAGQQLAATEKQRTDAARFSSNIAYARPAEQASSQQNVPGQPSGAPQSPFAAAVQAGQPTALTTSRGAGEQRTSGDQIPATDYKRPSEVNIDNAVGQPYVIYEGLTLDTVLMNRLDGDAVGPVKVLVSNPVYSHDHQHILIPEGTIVLGEARKIGSAGFGQQRRISVAFHRLLMPDGYSVDLDQFHGLDQIGEEGLKDQVNNHYLQIFGTSIALGVISGASQISQGGSNLNSSGSQSFTNGAASSVSQSATTILDKFIQIPPTITIREGHRVKVYFTQDMLLPAYENHRIAQSF